jgi:hypothetical protein
MYGDGLRAALCSHRAGKMAAFHLGKRHHPSAEALMQPLCKITQVVVSRLRAAEGPGKSADSRPWDHK